MDDKDKTIQSFEADANFIRGADKTRDVMKLVKPIVRDLQYGQVRFEEEFEPFLRDFGARDIAGTDPKARFRYLLAACGDDRLPKALAPLLAWACYYHSEDGGLAQAIYQKTGLAEARGIKFRYFNGKPRDRFLVRSGARTEVREIDENYLGLEGPALEIDLNDKSDHSNSSDNELGRTEDTSDPSKYRFAKRGAKRTAGSPQPTLRAPRKSQQKFHFSNSGTQLLERQNELATLDEFVSLGPGFRWFQLAGVGGQGKSRLACKLLDSLDNKEWCKGFLTQDELRSFSDKWQNWSPSRPHLMIIDYVAGLEADAGKMMGMLAQKPSDDWSVPVLVLLLERQPWNRGRLLFDDNSLPRKSQLSAEQSRSRAAWFDTLNQQSYHDLGHEDFRFETGVLELRGLSDDALTEIVRTTANDAIGDIPAAQIVSDLRRIDGEGRPLFAYLLGEVLRDNRSKFAWTKESLLDAILKKEQSRRWQFTFSPDASGDRTTVESWSLPIDHCATKLATLATITCVLDYLDIRKLETFSDVSDLALKQARFLTGTPDQTPVVDTNGTVVGLEPDILGEWFAIKALVAADWAHEILEAAWACSPQETANFLLRIAQDFPHVPEARSLISKPPTSHDAEFAYQVVLPDILGYLVETDDEVPSQIISEFKSGLNSTDGRVLTNIGLCYHNGLHFERSYSKAISYFLKGADASYPGAYFLLGSCYEEGHGVDQDFEKAAAYYSQAVGCGHVAAMMKLGYCYERGTGVRQDYEKAASLYERSARAGNLVAAHNLAHSYANGLGVSEDFDQAVHWYRIAAEGGLGQSMHNLGFLYEEGKGVEADFSIALSWFRQALDAGYSEAHTKIGIAVMEGLGTEKDPDEAIDWFKKGIDAGDTGSKYNLGVAFERGNGVPQDLTKARSLYEEAAGEGHPNAIYNLAVFLHSGLGGKPDQARAVSLFTIEANGGNISSIHNLALCYATGIGVVQDVDEAQKWYLKAAQLEHVPSMLNLALLIFRQEMEDRFPEAVDYLLKCADQGVGDAMHCLSVCFRQGLGVGRDDEQADRWQRMAVGAGFRPQE